MCLLFLHHLCPVDADLICEFITGDSFSDAFRSVYVCIFFIQQHEFKVKSSFSDVYSIFPISPIQFTSKLDMDILISYEMLMFIRDQIMLECLLLLLIPYFALL